MIIMNINHRGRHFKFRTDSGGLPAVAHRLTAKASGDVFGADGRGVIPFFYIIPIIKIFYFG